MKRTRALVYGSLVALAVATGVVVWLSRRAPAEPENLAKRLPIDTKLFPRTEPEPLMTGAAPLTSQLCTEAQFKTPLFAKWADELKETPRLNRKQWEFVFIAQALSERGMLAPGKKGLGFGVGKEPLPALFAKHGAEVLATDLEMAAATAKGWVQGDQHMDSLEVLNTRGIATPDEFARLVKGRDVDMTAIPPDLVGFDFTWSSCALGHLGNLKLGMDFIENSLKTLKPGGIAVHTTELNLSSNTVTMENPNTSVSRRHDIEELVRRLRAEGHEVTVNYNFGRDPLDESYVDLPPYNFDKHIKIDLEGIVATSFGLIIRKNPAAPK